MQTLPYTQIIQQHQRHPAYRNFVTSLKSPATRKTYSVYLSKYLNAVYVNSSLSSLDDILSKDVKVIQSEIIEILIRLQEDEKQSTASCKLFLAAVTHFFAINDVMINRKKIKKFIGEHTTKTDYRSYTTEEVSRILDICDERDKMIVLILASTGMRVGALPELKIKHLKRWNINQMGNYVYQITVYASSVKYRYNTFCTPECAKAIDRYLELRHRCGHEKDLKQDPQTGDWITPKENTYLIIRQFDKSFSNSSIYSSIPIQPHSITNRVIIPKTLQLGIRKKIVSTLDRSKNSSIRHELHPCHSFRIFAVTNMQRAKVDKTIREMLVGHATGLDKVYYKPQDDEILQEYLKAVDLLTIDNENRLQKQVDYYKERADKLELMAARLDNIEKKWGI